ncbi:MAG: hypothetical protein AAF950_08735 [Pseudomonadota bacterium]
MLSLLINFRNAVFAIVLAWLGMELMQPDRGKDTPQDPAQPEQSLLR